MKRSATFALLSAACTLYIASFGAAEAQAAGRDVRNTTRTSVNNNANINRDRNINANSNVNRNVNANVNHNTNVNVNQYHHVDIDVHDNYNPFATAVAVTAGVAVTSAVIGSMTHTLPPACVPVQYGTMLYQQCGTVWYQPSYVGTTVQYVVVTAPR
jgi:tRNA G26 N,N-dimethylase Trm1